MRMCNKPLDDGGFCSRVGDHDDACDALPILDQLCEQDERFRKAAVAHVRDLLATARAEGRREGLEEAAKLARENEACHVCGCELLAPEGKPYCEDTCHARQEPAEGEEYEIDHGCFIPTSDRIRSLLSQSPPSLQSCPSCNGPVAPYDDGWRKGELWCSACRLSSLDGGKVWRSTDPDPARDMAERIVGRLRELVQQSWARGTRSRLPDVIAREFLPAEKGTKT